MVNDSVLVEEKEGGGMTKEEEEEEREAQELREWNAKNGTGSDGTGGGSIKSKEEWLKASKERREAQEALEGPINTHTNLDVCFLCAKPATSICEVCRLVGFCGPEHAHLHRPEQFCFPFMVEMREGVGRFVVATRDIEPLELVMWDNAAALGPRMGTAPVCLQCLKPVDGSYMCPECGWPMCDEKCAKGRSHEIECSTLKAATKKIEFTNFTEPHDSYRAIAPLRLLKVKEKIPETWERLSYLMDHNEERSADPGLWGTYRQSVNELLQSADPKLCDEDIDRAVGLLWVNAFACSNGGGQAIFPTFSFMSHSCAPNCAHSVFPNKTLALQAKVKILAGTEFTISYISPLQGLLKRRMKLRDKWYFDCGCARCNDATSTELGSYTSAMLCQACDDADACILSENPRVESACWKCNKCGHKMSAEEVNESENTLAMEMSKVDNRSLSDFEMFHEKLETLLHPKHYLMIMLKRHLAHLYSSVLAQLDDEDLERVKKYAEDVASVYDVIDPGYQKERGTILGTLCEVQKMLAKRYLNQGKETEEQFRERVKECVHLFQEAQKCAVVRVKKDPNDISKYLIVQRKDPKDLRTEQSQCQN